MTKYYLITRFTLKRIYAKICFIALRFMQKKCMFIGIFNHILSNKRNKTKTHRTQLSASSSAPRAPPGVQSCSVFFPRASERRVLPIVGVCKTSSHLHIFSSSHLLIFTSSHLHIFLSSHLLLIPHLLIFTSSHLHIFSSSHLLIFTSSHLHIFSSSHLLILTSSPHLLIFTSPHLLIFTSSHLHIFSSSHLLIFTSSHLLTSSHIFSHLLTSSHIFSHLLTSSHLHIFSSHIFSSCPLALSFFSISLLKAGAGAVPTRRHETQPFRTK